LNAVAGAVEMHVWWLVQLIFIHWRYYHIKLIFKAFQHSSG